MNARLLCPGQFVVGLCVLSVILAGCSNAPARITLTNVPTPTNVPTLTNAPTLVAPTAAYWPTQAWRSSRPEEQGMDAQKLAEMLSAIQQQHLNMHSLLVVRNGYLVSETYLNSSKQDTRHELFSCTKSFVSTLIGIAMDKGYIDRADHRIMDLIAKRTPANLDRQKQDMTLEDVLTMRTGLDWQEGDPAIRAMYGSRDWVQFMLDKPMVRAPGSGFNYCSGCSHLLSAILQETTGMKTREFAEQYLFKPLGISNVTWSTDAAGIPIGGWGLQLTPRDMAKLGYLYFRDGQWEGKQIVSAQWVKNATQRHTETDSDLGYGYQWWTYPSLAAYAALGRYGQTIFVIPSSDLVIVTTAEMDNHDAIFQLIEQYIVPAAQKTQ